MGLRFYGSGNADLDAFYQSEVFTTDENNQLRTPVNNPDGSFTFERAVKNFQASFDNDDDDGSLNGANITSLFSGSFASITPGLEDPFTLDLITRSVLVDNSDPNSEVAQIEYTIDLDSGDVPGSDQSLAEVIASELGVDSFSEFTLVILDEEPGTPGFQIDGDDSVNDGTDFFITSQQAREDAVEDIEFIIDNDLLGNITGYFVDGDDENITLIDGQGGIFVPEPVTIVKRGGGNQTIIQAEDLNLHVYQKEFWHASNPERPESFEVISLHDAPDDTGTATLDLDQFSITPGTYDLTLSVFDENDGQAQLDVLLDGHLLPNGSIRLDEMGTSNGLPTEDIRREFVIQGIEITSSSEEISIVGTANQDEFARVDFLVFTESDI